MAFCERAVLSVLLCSCCGRLAAYCRLHRELKSAYEGAPTVISSDPVVKKGAAATTKLLSRSLVYTVELRKIVQVQSVQRIPWSQGVADVEPVDKRRRERNKQEQRASQFSATRSVRRGATPVVSACSASCRQRTASCTSPNSLSSEKPFGLDICTWRDGIEG